jgi:hypothetical protein
MSTNITNLTGNCKFEDKFQIKGCFSFANTYMKSHNNKPHITRSACINVFFIIIKMVWFFCFSLNSALLSRCRVVVLNKLAPESIRRILVSTHFHFVERAKKLGRF